MRAGVLGMTRQSRAGVLESHCSVHSAIGLACQGHAYFVAATCGHSYREQKKEISEAKRSSSRTERDPSVDPHRIRSHCSVSCSTAGAQSSAAWCSGLIVMAFQVPPEPHCTCSITVRDLHAVKPVAPTVGGKISTDVQIRVRAEPNRCRQSKLVSPLSKRFPETARMVPRRRCSPSQLVSGDHCPFVAVKGGQKQVAGVSASYACHFAM